MAPFLVSILIFSMAAHTSANWCVCKKGGQNKAYQEAIDFACGNGADCTQTHDGGRCFSPDTAMDHCNYAVNSYFQNKRQAPGTCDFSGVAMVVTADPSSNGCTFPTSASGITGSTNNTRLPGSTSTSPYGNNPSNTGGILGGGMGGGMGPSASSMNTDVSHAGIKISQQTNTFAILAILCVGVTMLTWI